MYVCAYVGIMRTEDFAHIFKEDSNRFKFPLDWKAEYIRLLTTFEVAVELSDDQLLVPSSLPRETPVLHELALPDEVVCIATVIMAMK